jgi:hypothetical protein
MGFEALQHALVLGMIEATGLGNDHLLALRPAGMERTGPISAMVCLPIA